MRISFSIPLPSVLEAETEEPEVDSFISQAEVTEVGLKVVARHQGWMRFPLTENLKSLNVVGLSWQQCMAVGHSVIYSNVGQNVEIHSQDKPKLCSLSSDGGLRSDERMIRPSDMRKSSERLELHRPMRPKVRL